MTKGDDDQKDIAKQFSSIKWRGDDLREVANHLRWQARQQRAEPTESGKPPEADNSPMPRPGDDGATWDDLFDWLYARKPEWTDLDLIVIADMIGFAHGTVRNEHSKYKPSIK